MVCSQFQSIRLCPLPATTSGLRHACCPLYVTSSIIVANTLMGVMSFLMAIVALNILEVFSRLLRNLWFLLFSFNPGLHLPTITCHMTKLPTLSTIGRQTPVRHCYKNTENRQNLPHVLKVVWWFIIMRRAWVSSKLIFHCALSSPPPLLCALGTGCSTNMSGVTDLHHEQGNHQLHECE